MTTLGMTLITELISLIKFPQQLHRIIIIIIARESDPENRYAVHFLFMMEVEISINDPLCFLSGLLVVKRVEGGQKHFQA